MTEETPPDAPKRNPLAEEAALWFARMRGPEAKIHRPSFEAWLARGALHRAAYNRAAEIFSMGKLLDADETEQPPQRSSNGEDHPDREGRSRSGGIPFMLVGFCLVLLLAWAVLARPMPSMPGAGSEIAGSASDNAESRLSTRSGETRTGRLADGSTVVLQPDSLLIVSFDKNRRSLDLDRGAARFTVAHEQRPFVVSAGGGSIVAKGTVFEVRIAADNRVTVKLVQGSIDVSIPSVSKTSTVARLKPGQTLSYSPAPGVGTPTPEPSASPVAAFDAAAMREYDQVRLRDVLAEANTRAPPQIILADPVLGDRTVSGRFRINDPQRLAERLAWVLNLKVARGNAGEIILSAP